VPTYIYETIDPTKPIRELEVKQSVHDDPIVSDPLTGDAIRRIAAAGYGVIARNQSNDSPVDGVGGKK